MINFLLSYSWALIIVLVINLYFGIYVLAPRIEKLNLNSTTKKYTYVVFFLSILSFFWGTILLFQLAPEWGQFSARSLLGNIRGNIMLVVIPFAVLIASGFLIRMCYHALQYFKSSSKKSKKSKRKIKKSKRQFFHQNHFNPAPQ